LQQNRVLNDTLITQHGHNHGRLYDAIIQTSMVTTKVRDVDVAHLMRCDGRL